MGIKYTGNVEDYVHGRTKRQNITRWMYIPEPKYKPTWRDVLWAIVWIVAVVPVIAFFVVWFMYQ